MADQSAHLRDAAIDAGREAIAHWEMIGEPEATELVTLILDAADAALRDIADPVEEPGPVLWEGPTMQATRRNSSNTGDITIEGHSVLPPSVRLPAPHGTHVVVTREVTTGG